jgi:uncharacterized protein YhaN
MRLLRLDLKAVGPFTGVSLDLAAGRHGLHMIYGPNEAGKTSTLRALSYLLFDFPHQTADNFVHPYEQLRVGALLRHSDGEVLEVIRRKAAKNPLRGPDDTAAVPSERLDRFLGGLDRDGFETLFGIDHTRLTRAGEEIRNGQGRLGELLFTAGTGLAGLRQAQERLQAEIEKLFKPRGQNPRINQALNEFRAGQETLKTLQLSSDAWQQHDRAFREAQERAARLGEQIAARDVERNRLERIRAAVPLAARRRMLAGALDALGDVPRLRDDFGPDCRAAAEALQLALRTIALARETIEGLDVQVAASAPPRELLDAADDIEALKERLGAEEKARRDRERLERFLSDHAHQARALLRELGRPEDLEAAEALRLRADEPASIRVLAKQAAALFARRDETLKAIDRLEDQARRVGRKLEELGEPRDLDALRHAVRQARKAGDVDDRHDQARVGCDRAEKAAARALARLPGWSRTLEALERLAVPLEATVDRHEADLQAAEAALHALDESMAAQGETIGQLEARIQALSLEQDVPTEADLHAARRQRDIDWRRVRQAGREGRALDDEVADAFEQGQARADALADRLRREADRVTRKAEWLSQLEGHRTGRAARMRERQEAADRLASLRDAWTATAAPLGAPAATPAELRAWLRRRDEVLQLAEHAHAGRQAAEPLAQLRDDHRRSLQRALVALGQASPDDAGGRLSGWLERAEDLLEREEKTARGREKLRTQAEEARTDLAREQLSLKAAEAELASWRVRWAEMMQRVGLEPGAAPDQAEVVLDRTQKLFETLHEHREFQSRIRGIDRDAAQFAADVGALGRRVAAGLDGQPAEIQTRTLAARLREARAVQERHTALGQQRAAEDERLRAAEAARDAARIRVERLCHEAGTDSPEGLAEAERRSSERGRLEDALRDCEDQLLALGGGAVAGEFADAVARADPDALGPRIERLDREREELHAEWEAVNQAIGAERRELEAMDGDDHAAAAAETVQTTLARLQVDVGRYAALRLAAAVLRRGIERYREKNQGPVLARASRLFAGLTTGSFAGLQIDDDGAGPVLKGVRPDGRLVAVDAMSDGSHDQLYLALRLASLESWLVAHEPVPFVVDDILLNFDDSRALAALRALGELSRLTQVLFFTHHRHLVDLAEAHLAPDVLFVHELPRVAPPPLDADVPAPA